MANLALEKITFNSYRRGGASGHKMRRYVSLQVISFDIMVLECIPGEKRPLLTVANLETLRFHLARGADFVAKTGQTGGFAVQVCPSDRLGGSDHRNPRIGGRALPRGRPPGRARASARCASLVLSRTRQQRGAHWEADAAGCCHHPRGGVAFFPRGGRCLCPTLGQAGCHPRRGDRVMIILGMRCARTFRRHRDGSGAHKPHQIGAGRHDSRRNIAGSGG